MRRLLRTLTMVLALALVFVVGRGDLFRASTTTTSLPAVSACSAAQLHGTWVDGTAGAGTVYAWITVTNTQETCTLPTWLDVVMGTDISATADQFSRVPVLAEMTKPDGGAITKSRKGVTLAVQESATVAISFSDRSGCDLATSVTVSWLSGAIRQELPIAATYLVSQCSGPSAFVSPVFR
ncbi:MAG: DUF4232 domain-containing protein [Actinomycetes bacterium]